jgi:divalent metal cation (Fe/Co/Zn/Cd) transporter
VGGTDWLLAAPQASHLPQSAIEDKRWVAPIGCTDWLFRKVTHGAKEEQSSEARADAWHHRADAISSLAALVDVAIAVWGPKWTGQAWLAAADEWAALVGAAIILGTAWSIL